MKRRISEKPKPFITSTYIRRPGPAFNNWYTHEQNKMAGSGGYRTFRGLC